MKKIKYLFSAVSIALLFGCKKTETTPVAIVTPPVVNINQRFLPDGWTALEDFGGGSRSNAVSFTINDKVYIGTGYSSALGYSNVSKDFYEYDPATKKWNKMADFPGPGRANSISFVIGDKAYVGLGTNYNRVSRAEVFSDFYEFDPKANTWTRKTDFQGTPRDQSAYFTIDKFGYIGSGNPDPFQPNNINEFWKYDPLENKWSKIAEYPGEVRCRAFAFAISGKGYVGGGEGNGRDKLNDMYEYEPIGNKWTKKNNIFRGIARASAFAHNNIGYVLGGITGADTQADNLVYVYDPTTDKWTFKSDMASKSSSKKGRYYASCIPLKNKVYVGLGAYGVEDINQNDFYEFEIK
jgi:N-acetylneuraminic acid mutarotase